jgi:hypothetical protein
MAKKKNEAKVSSEKGKKPAKSRAKLWLIFTIFAGVVFLPTSMLLFIGMLPSLVAFLVSGRAGGAKVSTVTAMNLAGCIPFIFKLWSSGNDPEASIDIITNTRFISIMYMAAAFGYMVDWVVTGIVSSFLYQRGIRRMEDIVKRQKVLKKQWGDSVDESTSLDTE